MPVSPTAIISILRHIPGIDRRLDRMSESGNRFVRGLGHAYDWSNAVDERIEGAVTGVGRNIASGLGRLFGRGGGGGNPMEGAGDAQRNLGAFFRAANANTGPSWVTPGNTPSTPSSGQDSWQQWMPRETEAPRVGENSVLDPNGPRNTSLGPQSRVGPRGGQTIATGAAARSMVEGWQQAAQDAQMQALLAEARARADALQR